MAPEFDEHADFDPSSNTGSGTDAFQTRAQSSSDLARLHAAALVETEGVFGGVGLDVESVLVPLLDLAVPEFSDWCAVDVISDKNDLRSAAFRHRGPDHANQVNVLAKCCDPSLFARVPELAAIRSRVLTAGVAEAWPQRTDADLPWCVVASLRVNNVPLGTITFVRDAGRYGFDQLDVEAATLMTDNTGRAIERMRLRRETREAARRTQRVASQLHQLIAASFTVNSLTNEQDIAISVAGSAQSVFGADIAVVSLESDRVSPLRVLARRSKRTIIVERDGESQFEKLPSYRSGKTAPWGEDDWLIAPILENRRRARGIVAIRRELGAQYGAEDIEILTLLAQTASTALSAAEMSRTIQNSEARWRALVETAPVGIIEIDSASRVRWWNQAAARIFAWPKFSFNLQGVEPPIPESARNQLNSLWADVLGGEAPIGREFLDVEVGERRRDLTASAVLLPTDAGGSGGILTLIDDVTDAHQMKTEIRHAHRMEIRGQVASNLAHDFNNLLTLISGYAEMLSQNLDADESSLQMVGDIQATVARASGLTSQLLSIGRTKPAEPVVLDPVAAIQSIAEVLERILGVDIELVLELASASGNVIIDADQFEQMILNLAINARDAMAEGGQLRISVEPISLAANELAPNLDGGEFVRISVTDTGRGMDEETRLRCFEPMFTTKGPLKGSGLGLAAARRLVEGGGGRIRCSSTVGVGTTFEILLPRAGYTNAGDGTDIHAVRAAVPARAHRAATILLAEDEDHIRRLIVQILKRNDYQVIEAESGERALQLALEQDGDIDLLLSDVVMPTMSGIELAQSLQVMNPHLRVLLMSGSEGAEVVDGLAPETSEFLAKPFRPSELVDRILTILS